MHTQTEAAPLQASATDRAIWNPLAAAGWSIVFTPAFGAWLVMRNWETLGDAQQAANARKWFCFSLGLLGVQVLSAAFNARLNSESNLMHWVGLAYLLVWGACAALPQARRVRARFGAGYARRDWDNALLCAVVAGCAFFLLRGIMTFLFVTLT